MYENDSERSAVPPRAYSQYKKKIEVPKYVKLKYILSEDAFAEILFGTSNTCIIWNVHKWGLLIPAKEGHRG